MEFQTIVNAHCKRCDEIEPDDWDTKDGLWFCECNKLNHKDLKLGISRVLASQLIIENQTSQEEP